MKLTILTKHVELRFPGDAHSEAQHLLKARHILEAPDK